MRILTVSSFICLLLPPIVGFAAEPSRPNILIIYADDLGFGETGVQGCKDIPTPHIDSIAKNGVRCTQGYVAATYCSPSRAGLMTGKYPTRFGHEFNAICRTSGLSLKETTIADSLKKLGYAWSAQQAEPTVKDNPTNNAPKKNGKKTKAA